MGWSTLVLAPSYIQIISFITVNCCTTSTVLCMYVQVWNEDLAKVAQTYAAQCKGEHNPDRGQNQEFSVGENLFVGTAAANYEGAVQSWYKEEKYYDYDTNTCQSSKVCGHYTQVCTYSS